MQADFKAQPLLNKSEAKLFAALDKRVPHIHFGTGTATLLQHHFPRYLPGALPFAKVSAAAAGTARQKITALYAPQKAKQTVMITGSPAEAAKELVKDVPHFR